MIFEFQISASSLRQLSILRLPASATVRPTSSAASAAPARKPLLNALFISVSLFTGVRPLLKILRVARDFVLEVRQGRADMAMGPGKKVLRALLSAGARGDQRRAFHIAGRRGEAAPGCIVIDARDGRDNVERTAAELVVVGAHIDHQAAIDVAEARIGES